MENKEFIKINAYLYIRKDKIVAVEAVPCEKDFDKATNSERYKVRIDVNTCGDLNYYYVMCKTRDEAQRMAADIMRRLA